MTMILKVSDMSCPHCVMRIKAALLAEHLASSVIIDLGTKEVKLEDATDRTAIIRCIEHLGYHVEE